MQLLPHLAVAKQGRDGLQQEAFSHRSQELGTRGRRGRGCAQGCTQQGVVDAMVGVRGCARDV